MMMKKRLAVTICSYGLMKFEVLGYAGMGGDSKRVRDIKLIIIQFGAALAVSFAGFLYSNLRKKKVKHSLPASCSACSSDQNREAKSESESRERPMERDHLEADGSEGLQRPKIRIDDSVDDLYLVSQHGKDDDGLCFPSCNKLPEEDAETARSNTSTNPEVLDAERVGYECEITELRNTVTRLQEQEKNLKVQLFEYDGLKEQQAALMELRNRLKINQMEFKLFNFKIESLQADNKRLRKQVAEHAEVLSELEAAKSQIKLLKKKLRIEAQQNKEMILSLKEKVTRLQEQEIKSSVFDPDVQTMMKRLKELEAEKDELKTYNTELQLENSELAQRLESTQILATSKLKDSEVEVLEEERHQLKCENEALRTEIEQLQGDRCKDLEELVYLRWINACLRYELRNYQPPQGKEVAKDLSKTLSPRSEQKAKELILEYAHSEGLGEKGIRAIDFDSEQWSSSPGSNITDSGELDNTSVDTSSAGRTYNSKKQSILGKLKRLVHGKDTHRDSLSVMSDKADSPEHRPYTRCSSSSGVNTMSRLHCRDLATPKQHLRHSLDIQRLRNNGKGASEDAEGCHRHTEANSNVCRRQVVRRHSSTDLSLENQEEPDWESAEKIKLIKLADALKGSRSQKNWHKKSASYCFGES